MAVRGLSSKRRLTLGILVGFLAAAGFYYFILSPQMTAYTRTWERLKDTREELNRVQALIEAGKTEEEKYDEVMEELDEVMPFFDAEFQDGSALAALGLQAMKRGIYISSLTPHEAVVKSDYLELPLHLELTGLYRSVVDLIDDLEHWANLLEIRKLSIRSGEEQQDGEPVTGDTLVKAECTLVIYSDLAPGEKLSLNEISAWQKGRRYPFTVPAPVSPHPDVPAGGDGTVLGYGENQVVDEDNRAGGELLSGEVAGKRTESMETQ